MERRAALQRIAAMSFVGAAAGCAEFGEGYSPAEMPRFVPIQWPENRPKTALVLGSGGPRGFAHIGVLKVLEAAGIEPALVVGSSAGAIAGALYAAKIPAPDIERRALDLGITEIADPAFLQPTKFIGRALQNFINSVVQERAIEALPRRSRA